MGRSQPMARLFWMTSGFAFWAAQFTVIYGITGVACARGWYRISFLGVDIVQASIGVATVLALAATAVVFWGALARERGPRDASSEGFIETATLWICGLSLVAILYTGVPALILPACSA